MDTQGSQSPTSRPLWMRLLVGMIRCLPFALIVGFWVVAIARGQIPIELLIGAIGISLLYMFFWTLKMLVSHRARIAFKKGRLIFWAGLLVVLMLWAGWLFLLTDPQLHTIFQGLAVLAIIFFGIGVYAAYVALPREGEEIDEDVTDIDGCGEGCLDFILGSFIGW